MKKVLFIILGLVALVLIAALIAPKDYKVEREIVINKPKAEVFEYVKHVKNQDNYSVWAKADPNMKKEFKGEDATVGFVSSWDSNEKNVGKGEQEIKNITDGERIDMELRFKKPFEATDQAYMITEGMGDAQTKVKWGFTGSMPMPMNLMLVFMSMDKEIGNDLATGLDNLKIIMEQMPATQQAEATEPAPATQQ